MTGKLTAEWTQRPLLRIISTIKDKLIQKIGENIGEVFAEDIADALADGGLIEQDLKDLVQNEEIGLVD